MTKHEAPGVFKPPLKRAINAVARRINRDLARRYLTVNQDTLQGAIGAALCGEKIRLAVMLRDPPDAAPVVESTIDVNAYCARGRS